MIETHLHKSRQTIKLGLIKIMRDLFPGENFKIAYSIQEGVFCRLSGSVLSIREVAMIEKEVKAWVLSDPNIDFLGRTDGYYYYRTGETVVELVYPCEMSTRGVDPFAIIPYGTGFIIDFGDVGAGGNKPLIPPDKLSEAYHKTQNWLRNVDLEVMEDVNGFIKTHESHRLMELSEALHEKEISDIADTILQQRRALRVLLISGPSSSGKTTFSHRISTQLRVNGLKTVALSLDDYFLNEEDKPKDENGRCDWECIEALDLLLLREQVRDLIDGKVVATPLFSFKNGKRKAHSRKMQIGSDEILVIEGLHALNPRLLSGISRNSMFKIYINALFEINIDLHNRIPSSEIRLLRRLVRGDRFRGTDPEVTLDQWLDVRKGEFDNVFKFQEEADVMFNSSLVYEMNALRPYAEATLAKLKEDSSYAHVKERLLNILTFCEPMDSAKVPYNSILREFIGESIYYE